jgi:SagB-type dehydrogenase family enzyme
MKGEITKLPSPKTIGSRGLERVMSTRRSIREYSEQPLTIGVLSQLLWACQGITSNEGLRTTPSAGATYPLEVFAAVHKITGLDPGVYHYLPGPDLHQHSIQIVHDGSVADLLFKRSTEQDFIRKVPVNIIFSAVLTRIRKEYGRSAMRYTLLEAGHAAQNLHLMAEGMNLGSVAIGYLNASAVKRVLHAQVLPLYMVSIGKKMRK